MPRPSDRMGYIRDDWGQSLPRPTLRKRSFAEALLRSERVRVAALWLAVMAFCFAAGYGVGTWGGRP